MPDQTEVVDFSEAPQPSTFGRDADGGYISDDHVQQAEDAITGNIPFVSQYNNVIKEYDETLNPPEPYFHGEWWEELLILAQNTLDAGSQIVEAVDLAETMVNSAVAQNYLDLLGIAAGAVFKGQLQFLMGSVQPIQDAAGVLLGNEEKVKNSAAMWRAVSENLTRLEEAIGPDLSSTLNECWGGQAGCAASVRGSDLIDAVAYASASSMQLSDMLEIYAELAKRVNGLVVDILADVVATVISAAGDIATKGWAAIITIAIDLELLFINYCMKLAALGIQVVWFAIAGTVLGESLRACFDHVMEVLRELAGYTSA